MSNTSVTKSNMDNYVENILAENLTLKRKLDSKCQAVLILNKELSECMVEKDQYKLVAEQLQKKLSCYKKNAITQNCFTEHQDECISNSNDAKEGSRNLVFEIESLRQKLRDALGDIKALRSQLNQQKSTAQDNSGDVLNKMDKEEELVKQLEGMSKVKSQLEMDLQSIIDEKEELITERDSYKCKVHRLNHELNMLLKGENRNVIDIDSLIMENRFLQESLQQMQEEVKLANKNISRFKAMLGNRQYRGNSKTVVDNVSEMLLSEKQVQDLLHICSSDQSATNSVASADAKSVCVALLENLNDKDLALAHQRKTNRILAARIYELEQRFEIGRRSTVSTFPSKVLLDGYVGADVDGEGSSDPRERPVKSENCGESGGGESSTKNIDDTIPGQKVTP